MLPTELVWPSVERYDKIWSWREDNLCKFPAEVRLLPNNSPRRSIPAITLFDASDSRLTS